MKIETFLAIIGNPDSKDLHDLKKRCRQYLKLNHPDVNNGNPADSWNFFLEVYKTLNNQISEEGDYASFVAALELEKDSTSASQDEEYDLINDLMSWEVDEEFDDSPIEPVLYLMPTELSGNKDFLADLDLDLGLIPHRKVELPAGYFDPSTKVLHRTALIRALDQSAKTRAETPDFSIQKFNQVLEFGILSIGPFKPTSSLLSHLLAGDREFLYMQIHIETYGKRGSLHSNCPYCGCVQDFEIDLDLDIPVIPANPDLAKRSKFVSVMCSIGLVELSLPNGFTHLRMGEADLYDHWMLDTIWLADCMRRVDGHAVEDSQSLVSTLNHRDRKLILDRLSTDNPGPEFRKIFKACKSCHNQVLIDITLWNFFPVQGGRLDEKSTQGEPWPWLESKWFKRSFVAFWVLWFLNDEFWHISF